MKLRHALIAALAMTGASQALSHAELLESSPARGAQVDASTCHVHLAFSEGVQTRFSDFSVHYLGDSRDTPISADNRVARPEAETDRQARKIGLAMPEDRQAGWYAVDWEVLAEDGHTTSGVIHFQVVADD